MNDRAPSPGGPFAAWVSLVRRRAWAVVLLSVALTGLAVVYLQHHIAINTDTADMLSAKLPFRQHDREVSRLFPQQVDNILLVFDGALPEQVDAAADAVTARLKADPATFGDAFDPEGDPFLRKNGLLFLSVKDLEALTGRLAGAQPFLASLWADASLPSLFGLLRQGLSGEGGKPPPAFGGVLDRLAQVAEKQGKGENAILSWQRLLDGSDGPVRRIIVLKPPVDYTTLHPGGRTLDALAAMRKELHLDGAGPVRLRLSGTLALQRDELRSVERGMGLAGLLSMVLVAGLLVMAFGALRLVGAVLVTLVAGLIWTAGFAILALGALNLISVAFAVLFIGLSVDFGIHFALRYREWRDGGADNGAALEGAAGAGGGGLALCALAAAISFYAFLPTDYVGLAELGLIAGTGMFIALFANLTLLPALLALMPVPPRKRRAGAAKAKPVERVRAWIEGHPRKVLLLAAAVAAGGLALLPLARFDFDPLNLQDRHLESVAVIHEFAEAPETSPYAATVLAPDLAAARILSDKLTALPEVAGVSSILSFVPADQREKVEIVQDLSLFLLPSLPDGGGKGTSTPETRKAATEALAQALGAVAGGGTDLAAPAGRLLAALAKLDGEGLARLERAYLGEFPRAVAQLRASLTPQPFAVTDLPAAIRDRYLAADGHARLTVHPKGDLRDPAELQRFVAAVRGVAPEASGTPVIIEEAGTAVTNAFLEAATIALVAILLLLAWVLRRAVDVALVFAPLLLAALLTAAASAVAGLAFNFANIIVLPLLFGLGVASGIHLVLRDRQERAKSGTGDASGAFETSTPRAVLYSALTTIGSFGSIALSGHPGTASMGVLLTIAIAMTLGCTLILLPALLKLRAGRT